MTLDLDLAGVDGRAPNRTFARSITYPLDPLVIVGWFGELWHFV